MSFTKYPTAP